MKITLREACLLNHLDYAPFPFSILFFISLLAKKRAWVSDIDQVPRVWGKLCASRQAGHQLWAGGEPKSRSLAKQPGEENSNLTHEICG